MATDNAQLTKLGTTGTHTGSAYVLPDTAPDPAMLAMKYGELGDQKRAQKQAALAQLGSAFGEGWDVDMPLLAQVRTELINKHAGWVKEGKRFNDPAHPEWSESQNVINGVTDLFKASSQQKKYFDAAQGELQKNFKEYDVQASQQRLALYRNLSPVERDQVNPATLLVPKMVPLNDKINEFFKGKKPGTTSTAPVRVGTMYQWYDETGFTPTQMSGFATQMMTDPEVAHQVNKIYEQIPEEERKGVTPVDLMVQLMNPYSETAKKLNLQGIPQATKVNVNSNSSAGAGNDAEAEDILNRVARVMRGEGFEAVKGQSLSGVMKTGSFDDMQVSYDLQGLPIKESYVDVEGTQKKVPVLINFVSKSPDGKYKIHLDNGETMELKNKSAYQQIVRPYMQYSGRGEEFKQAVSRMAKKKGILGDNGIENWGGSSGAFIPGSTNKPGSNGAFIPGK